MFLLLILRTRMESMGSTVTNDQFMLHVLANLNRDYEVIVHNLEIRIGHNVD